MAKSSKSERASGDAGWNELTAAVAACRICRDSPSGKQLPHEPRPVLLASPSARLLVAGQAPGARVHQSGLPFTDPSGDRLREWMGVGKDVFYDPERVAIVPMGFCFPGLNEHKADLPPRRECRAHWHDRIMAQLPRIEAILVLGSYARHYHFTRLGFGEFAKARQGDVVREWKRFAKCAPRLFPLPHPSWRNSGWLKQNPWFEREVLPELRKEVARLTSNGG